MRYLTTGRKHALIKKYALNEHVRFLTRLYGNLKGPVVMIYYYVGIILYYSRNLWIMDKWVECVRNKILLLSNELTGSSGQLWFFLLCHRNPEALSRPSFCAIIIALQHPDHEILKWSEKDKAVSSKRAMTLGAPIEEGANLFKDLQHTYMQKPVV